MQAISIFVFNRVLLVVKYRTQAFMKMRHVITAVEIVVDENFPIAMDVVASTVEEMQVADAQGSHTRNESAEEIIQGNCIGIKIDKDKALPSFDLNRNQAIVGPLELGDAFELRHSFQRAIKPIFPSVIRTLKNRSMSARLRYHRRGVMATDIVKRAQMSIVSSNNDDRLSGNAR